MDDDFLYPLRKRPPTEFARRLEAQLARRDLEQRLRSRPRLVPNVVAVLLVGGAAAFAASFVSLHGLFTLIEDPAAVPRQERVAQARNDASTRDAAAERRRVESPRALDGASRGRSAGASKPAPAVAPRAPENTTGVDSTTNSGLVAATGRIATWPRDKLVILTAPSAHDYTRDMAERFGRGGFAEPHVETQNARNDWSAFCASRGLAAVHVVVRFDRMTAEERRACDELPGEDLLELKLGYESIVLARSSVYGAFPLSPREVFLALAAEVPDPDIPERLIANPHRTWSDVDETLPYDRIEVIGPRIDSVAGRRLAALILEAGCNVFPQIATLHDTDEPRYARICGTVRNDGAYVEMAEGFDFMLRMETYPNVVGVFSHHYFGANGDTLDAASIAVSSRRSRRSNRARTRPRGRCIYM